MLEVAAVENDKVGGVVAANAGFDNPKERTAADLKHDLRDCCSARVHGSNVRRRTNLAAFIVENGCHQ